MPNHREPLREVSATQLTELTGISPRSVRSRLVESGLKPVRADGRTQWWEPREALPILYKLTGNKGTTGPLDLNTERARESSNRADKLALENAEKRGELLPADSVAWFMAQRAAAYKSRSRSLATKSRSMLGLDAKQSKTLLGLIDDGLRALASEELPEGAGARLESDWARALATAGSDA